MCKIADVQAIAVVVFTDGPSDNGRAHTDFATVLGRRVEQSGFRLYDSVCQASNGWFSYLDDEPVVHPLSEITESACTSEVPEEHQPKLSLPDRVPDVDIVTMKRVRKKLDRLHALSHINLGMYVPKSFVPAQDFPLFAEKALSWTPDELAQHDALFIFSVMSPPMRDVVMLQWATDLHTGDRLFDASEVPIEAYDPDLARLWMGIGPRPDHERVESGIRLLEQIVARCEGVFRLAPLSMIAWLNWAIGQSSIAHVYLREAREIDPEYGMAELLDNMLSNGMFPEWAFEE
jgi:hypothetical protein